LNQKKNKSEAWEKQEKKIDVYIDEALCKAVIFA